MKTEYKSSNQTKPFFSGGSHQKLKMNIENTYFFFQTKHQYRLNGRCN